MVDVDAGFYVRFADLPQIEGTAGRFMLKQMALMAELEVGFISDRTKAALVAAKRRGKNWGLSCWRQAHAKARQKGAKANAEAPQLRAHRVQASGAASLRAVDHRAAVGRHRTAQTSTAIPSATTGANERDPRTGTSILRQ